MASQESSRFSRVASRRVERINCYLWQSPMLQSRSFSIGAILGTFVWQAKTMRQPAKPWLMIMVAH